MRNRRCLWYLPLALLVFVSFSPLAYGDLQWETVMETSGLPEGLPDNLPEGVREQMLAQFKSETKTVQTYLTSYVMRTEEEEDITIMNFESMMVYSLNTMDKTYTKIDAASAMESMGDIAKESVVTPTNETKTIAGYKCKKYLVTVMGMESEHWLSKDIKGYKEFKKICEQIYEKNPKLKEMGMMGFSGDEGFPVQTVNNVMGMVHKSTLKKIEKKSLSKDLFTLPEGYTLVEMKLPSQ